MVRAPPAGGVAEGFTMASRKQDWHSFDIAKGVILGGKYRVLGLLGAGWEGEVYLVRERGTGIDRAAKFFFPHRDPGNRNLTYYARKLHRLRHCPILLRYYTRESFLLDGRRLTCLVSDYVEGEPLSRFLARQPGRRLDAFQALHLLHALADGVACIHAVGEYHGDLHADNIVVRRRGLGFGVRLLDLFRWGNARHVNIQEDVCDLARLLYDITGGQRRYAGQPPEVKGICRGLKRTLILERFRTASQLRRHLERLEWTSR